jgi:uncharacterized membrane protein YfcA
MLSLIHCRFFRRAFGYCIPIGGLAGLIGLGGGEFRLPVLMNVVGFDAKSAVPLNLMVSLITLAFALVTRSHAAPIVAIVPHLPAIAGLALGGMVSAFYGARLVARVSDDWLTKLIAGLLGGIGLLLLIEAAFPFRTGGLLPAGDGLHLLVGFALGLGIGLVSSLLGVAGGELLIPALVFVFGVEIKTAGSASILISLAIVGVGLWRYRRLGAFPRGRGIQRITLAMSVGSLIGAALGGFAVAFAPIALLKVLLGCVLIAAAGKTALHQREGR